VQSGNGAITYREAENSAGDKESGTIIKLDSCTGIQCKHSNLVDRTKVIVVVSVPGESRPKIRSVKAGMNLVNIKFEERRQSVRNYTQYLQPP